MDWRPVAVLKYKTDETRPGYSEEDPGRKRGEKIMAAIDPEWPAFPRLSIRENDIVSGSVKCTLGSGKPLSIRELTDINELITPPPGEAFLRANSGRDYDEAYLYLHNDYIGEVVYVEYDYYPSDDSWFGFSVRDGGIYAITAAGRSYFYSDGVKRGYDLPGKPSSIDNRVGWAGGRGLYHFGRKHRPAFFISDDNDDASVIAVAITMLYKARLSYRPDRWLILSNAVPNRTKLIPEDALVSINRAVINGVNGVKVVFNDGYVSVGKGEGLWINLPYLKDVGIAKLFAEVILRENGYSRGKLVIELFGDYFLSPGDSINIGETICGSVISVKRYLGGERTGLEVLTKEEASIE